MVERIFLSLQVKGGIIISNKRGIFEFPHELTNNLRKIGRIRKISDFIELLPRAQSSPQNKNLSVLVKLSWKREMELFP